MKTNQPLKRMRHRCVRLYPASKEIKNFLVKILEAFKHRCQKSDQKDIAHQCSEKQSVLMFLNSLCGLGTE